MSAQRSAFGPSKDEIWARIAADIGGSYEEGGSWGHDILRYRSGEWEITLDVWTSDDISYTRMRAPFLNKDGLYFRIYHEGLLSSIGKVFGMQDINVADPFFDERFVIQGNNEDKIRQLLSDPKLKELIQAQPDILFEVKDDEGWFGARFPEGVDELYFQCYGILRDETLLKNLFEMFTLTLQRLVQMDSAYEKDPNVRL